jgi:hypothetical protein
MVYVKKIRHVLNTELMQFTLGKTQKTINDIKQSQQDWMEYLQINDDTVPGTRIIPIILTNNSLAETEQWTIRLEKELGGGIVIVSSKDTADYSNSSELINHMKECEISDLPSVIVMCTNGTRINTCKEIFKAFSHWSHSPRKDIIIRFDIAFDEIDKQTGLLKVFLKDLNRREYMTNNNEYELINKILYITATPTKDLFNTIRNFGVPEFENLDTNLERDYPRPNHEDLVIAYKCIKDDAIIYHESNSMPVEYVKEILNSPERYIDLDERKIIFAPAEIACSTHEEMTEVFSNLGFTVLLHNGKFKGFVEPNGARIPIEEFNKEHFKQKPQMMDTLRKWNELNPTKSLAITGYNTIERGVTFNTDGFNFTDVIISPYHAKQINKLLQLIGRNHGHTDYCKPCVVYTTEDIHKSVGKFIDTFNKLKGAEVERYNITDFSKSPSTIPVKITIVNNDLLTEIMDLLKSYSFKKGKLSCLEKGKKEVAYKRIHEIFEEYKTRPEYILWEDYNNRNKIDISERYIKTIRRYCGGDGNGRRFKTFSNNHDNRKASSQKGESDDYSLDVACEEFIDGSFVNPTNVMWLTFRVED